MSEQAPKEDRRFEPTLKRRREFRKEGRVAVSKDLASTVQLVAVIIGFTMLGNALLSGVAGAASWVMARVGDGGGQRLTMGDAVAAHLDALLVPTMALCGIFGAAAVIAYVMQTGFLFSPKAIGFKWDRLKPLKRMGDMFGPKKASVKVGLAAGKVGLTGFAIALALAGMMPEISALALAPLETSGIVAGKHILTLLLITVLILSVLATLDYLWQRNQIMEQMRMTREEIKKETEEEDGKPEVRQRRKQKHRELSLNRILVEVPTADVIVTNPTHYAVALRYRAGQDAAPIVVAKGVDDLALVIRKIARQHAIPIIEQRPLARALWKTVKLGRGVPANLFQAVAEVLATVYRAKSSRAPAR